MKDDNANKHDKKEDGEDWCLFDQTMLVPNKGGEGWLGNDNEFSPTAKISLV